MTLDEVIKHAEEVANDMELCCKECAEEHRQLAEWLKELKQYREQTNGDLISRQAVLDIFGDIHPLDYNTRAYVAQIKELPSADNTAEWITKWDEEEREERHYCTNCNKYQLFQTEFCSHCGAKMKGR